MPTHAQIAVAAMPFPGTRGSPWQRIAEGVVTLNGATKGALSGIGSWQSQLFHALDPKPDFGGTTWIQRLTGGGWAEFITALGDSGPILTLQPLSLSSASIAEDQPASTVVGAIVGATDGATVTLQAQSNANMFAKSGNNITVGAAGLDFETVPAPTITLRQTHPEATNSPLDTIINITVTDVNETPAEAVALFARMTSQPNAARKTLISNLINSLKAGAISGSNIWNKIDILHVLAAHDAQAAKLDWKNLGGLEVFNATLTLAPTFTADRGYLNNGTTNFVSTLFAGANGVAFSLNSAHLAAWSRTATKSTDAGFDFGRPGSARGAIGPYSSADLFLGMLNCSTAISVASATGAGFYSINRPNAAGQQLYRNGAQVATDSQVSTSVPLTLRVNGASPFNREVAIWSVGGSLTANEWLDYYNAVNTYLVAIGAA